METGTHFEDAMRQVHDILGPQFGQLPEDVEFKAWWDELGATRPSKLHLAAVEISRVFKLESRVTELENVVRELTARLEKLGGQPI